MHGSHAGGVVYFFLFSRVRSACGKRAPHPALWATFPLKGEGSACQKTSALPYRECRGDHWSPASLAQQRAFRDGFLTGHTGTGEQCSPLQEFFDSLKKYGGVCAKAQTNKPAGRGVGAAHVRPGCVRQGCACGKAAGRACPAPTIFLAKSFILHRLFRRFCTNLLLLAYLLYYNS